MRHAIITVGLGFGDEGKGATVDYLCRKYAAELVVRYNGGAQAGHNVVGDAAGHVHTFSQFGAGTFAGTPTYLGPCMIVNYDTLVKEASGLVTYFNTSHSALRRLLTIDTQCLVSTPIHVYLNRARETAARAARHGSCGLGIGETRSYWLKKGSDAIFAADCLAGTRHLYRKLSALYEHALEEVRQMSQQEVASSWLIPLKRLDVGQCAADLVAIANRYNHSDGPPTLDADATIVFEGAQGVLLDQTYGFHPNTTWSDVTPRHAMEMITSGALPVDGVHVLGITRTYLTRHGTGPFPTSALDERDDLHNPYNAWQESMRFGAFSIDLFDYALEVCRNSLGGINSLAVNCVDQTPSVDVDKTDGYSMSTPERPYTVYASCTDELNRIVKSGHTSAKEPYAKFVKRLRARAPISVESRGRRAEDRSLASEMTYHQV